MPRSFDSVFYGAAGTSTGDPVDDEFNRVSFLSHFEGANNGVNNAFDDGSANNYTVTAAGNVTQGSFGPFAREEGYWGVTFDGSTTGYISVPTDTDFDLTNATTLEFWVFIPEDQTDVLVLGRHNLYWFGADYAGGGGSANKFSFLVMPDGSSTFSAIHSSANIVYNQWYFVQLIYSGTTVTFYLDGASQGTLTSFTPEAGLSKPFYVGGYAGQLNANSILSNIRFSNVARSTSVPTAPFAIDSNTKLLLCSSNRFTDRSSQAAVVTTYVGAEVTAFGPFLTSSVYDPAVNGASAYMDGSGDTLRATWTAADIVNQNFTLEYWLYFQDTSGSGDVTIGDTPGSNYIHLSYSSGGDVWSDDGTHSGSGPYVSGAIKGNCWNHLALVRSGTSLYIYANGAKIGTKDNITTSYFSGQSDEFGIGYIANPLEGYICDARVVTSAVYSGATYTVPTAPLTAVTNTKLLLNMADGQAIDSAAQNNLTLVGTAKTSTAQKLFGTASLLLDGNSDLVTFPTEAGNFGTGNFTIEFSFRLAADVGSTPNSCVAKWETSGSQRSWMIRIDNVSSANKMKFFDSADGSANTGVTFSTSFSSETWYKIAVVNVSGTVSLYVNGTADSTTHSLATGAPYASTGLVSIGANVPSNPDNFFNGNIDEVRLSKFARYTGNYTAQSEAFPDKGQ